MKTFFELFLVAAVMLLAHVSAYAEEAEYDLSWYKKLGWSGEYPNGFTLADDVTINIRPRLSPTVPKSISCLLKKGATYHEWNKKRVVSDRLEFVSLTKIKNYKLKMDFTTELERKLDGRNVFVKFRKRDEWSFLTYIAEGDFLLRFKDVEYVGHEDLLDNSSQVSPPAGGNEVNYAEWLKLKCANSAVGWLLLEEIKDAPDSINRT